jgi:hypothetical protein
MVSSQKPRPPNHETDHFLTVVCSVREVLVFKLFQDTVCPVERFSLCRLLIQTNAIVLVVISEASTASNVLFASGPTSPRYVICVADSVVK